MFKNLIWLAAILAVFVGVIDTVAQDDPNKKPLPGQDLQKNQQNQQKEQFTTVSGVVYGVFDEQGKITSVEVRDEKGTSYSIATEGRGKDLLRLVDAKIRIKGRVMGGDQGQLQPGKDQGQLQPGIGMGKQTFHVDSYEATLGIAGKLVEREDNIFVLEEISFQEVPRVFKVLNIEDELEKLGIPFDKEIKANGVISVEGFATMPQEGTTVPREGTMPQEGTMPDNKNLPREGTLPDNKNLPQDQQQQVDRNKQVGMDAQREGKWTIRLSSYEPLEYIVGVVHAEKGAQPGVMNIRLEEEEKGIIFKEKGRTFEVSNMGRGPELRICDGAKIKAYGTLSKNQQGNWLLHVLAYQKEGSEADKRYEDAHDDNDDKDGDND